MIGLFDSGSGGLTVLHALRKKAPKVEVIYFGDIANAPYGEKSISELIQLTRNGVSILQKKGATALVSACNSVSAPVLNGASGAMPFIEMSLPTSAYLKQYQGQRFLLIATLATIESGLYEKAIKGLVSIDMLPIPNLAGAIEFDHSEVEMEEILNDAFSLRIREEYDGLILGCTHYPLIRSLIEKVTNKFFGSLRIIDPAYPVAETVCKSFDVSGDGIIHFLISKKSEMFERRIKTLFPESHYSIEVLA